MINFHYCKRYLLDIEGKQQVETIKKHFKKLETFNELRDSTGTVSPYAGDMYVLKIANSARVIVQKSIVLIGNQSITVYFVRQAILGGDIDYKWHRIANSALNKNEWLDYNPLNQSDIDDFIKKYLLEKKVEPTIEHRENPPSDLISWLDTLSLDFNYDFFETENWVKFATNDSSTEGMRDSDVKSFRSLIKIIFERKITTKTLIQPYFLSDESGVFTYIHEDEEDNIGIIYSEVIFGNKTAFILHNGAHTNAQKEFWSKICKDDYQIQIKSFHEISRVATRAYSSVVLKDDDLWFNIQKNKENGNLSLMSEQISFLNSLPFPSYIAAQAGSGKTTMLCYLFAAAFKYKYTYQYIEDLSSTDIVFLTENKSLLEQTKKTIHHLLNRNADFSFLGDESLDRVNECFYSFKDFLLSFVPSDFKDIFKPEKYLDFNKFESFYLESKKIKDLIKKEYTAEEVWFVINTFLRGYDEHIVKASDYELKIDKKARVISRERVVAIEDHVFPFYKSLLEEKYWDKIEIIRFIQNNKFDTRKYSLMICDEAQDFCKLELNFMINCCNLMEYDLSTVKKIPIVFAGDASQTVNPTGFRGAEVTSMMYNALEKARFKTLSTSNSNYTSKFNYRSTEQIVNLANLTQSYRENNKLIDSYERQESKRFTKETGLNVFLTINDILESSEILHKLKYKKVIVPVDSETKKEFVDSRLIDGNPDIDIRSSSEVKGDEFEQVIIYNFGEYYIEEQLDTDNDTDYFKKRYFYNKLYVAITRARTEIVIIDTERAKNEFWTGILKAGNLVDFDTKAVLPSSKKDAEFTALSDKQKGKEDANKGRLHLASMQFYSLGNMKEYYDCKALIAELDEKWLEAAKIYEERNEINDRWNRAAKCYWKGELWDELLNVGSKSKEQYQECRLPIAKLMQQSTLSSDDLNKLVINKVLLNELFINNSKLRKSASEKLLEFALNSPGFQIKREIADITKAIVKDEDEQIWETLGHVYYKLSDFRSAIEAYDNAKNELTSNYVEAKIQLARIEQDKKQEIIWLGYQMERGNVIEDIKKIAAHIVSLYDELKNLDLKDKDLPFLYSSVFYSYLLIESNPDKWIETARLFEDNNENISKVDFYENVLKNNQLPKIVILFVLERWAKAKIEKPTQDKDTLLALLNEDYENLAYKNSIDYIPFTIKEIETITEIPSIPPVEPPKHLDNLMINNFRQFTKLELSDLGKINLILGDNNVGKSSLLEALMFTIPIDQFVSRLVVALVERHKGFDYDNGKGNLLDPYFNKNSDGDIEFIINQGRKMWKFSLTKAYEYNGDKISSIESPLIPFGKGFGSDLANVFFEEIQMKGKQDEFIKNISLFINNVEGILSNPKNGDISIKEQGRTDYISLSQYGDGVNKLFRILVQMALNKNGRLLIDEIDSGIHYNHFIDYWKNIIKAANNYNIQLFATTHNEECIKYFKEVLDSDEFSSFRNNARVLTLRRDIKGEIRVVNRDYNSFDNSLNNNFDIRGGNL